MAIFKSVLLFFIIFCVKNFKDVDANCVLNLKKDFGSPSPVLLLGGQFLTPNRADGSVVFRRSQILEAACPGNQKQRVKLGNVTADVSIVEAKCMFNTTFKIGSWTGEFKDIVCVTQPWISTEEGAPCAGGKTQKVGYNIQAKFHVVYEACFDPVLLRTSYVKHQLSPTSQFIQVERRPQFIEGVLFGKIRMSELYKATYQKTRLGALLGHGKEQDYLSKNQFLSRGHLAPRADFSVSALQRATFHYVNTAPQWQRGNAGDWAALEDAVRRRVIKKNTTVSVYTGTHGTLQLEDKDGRPQDIHLTTDANNNGLVPVPLYFYKVVHDPQSKTATAFITINSSFFNQSKIEALSFCNDICKLNSDFSWLKWRSNDGTHSFCCDYDEFTKEIRELPKLDVKGLFF